MIINLVDYRGDNTIVNNKGETLFEYRTRYFRRVQDDFHYWKQHGHKFVCFTQHPNDNNFEGFDEVIAIPRGTAPQSRNCILEHYPADTWIGIWDNDATLYWDKLNSKLVPKELEQICQQADNGGLYAWVPFNAQQAPYPTDLTPRWTFSPTIQLKGTMTFIKTCELRFNEQQPYRDDVEYAFELTLLDRKVGMLDQASLREHRPMFSTIFKNNRVEIYQQSNKEMEDKLKYTFEELQAKQRNLWNIPEQFNSLFEIV
jgi:hypothetical protein